MAEMNTQEIMEYLKRIAELETSVHKQLKVKQQAYDDLKMPVTQKEIIEPPQKPKEQAKPKRPTIFWAFRDAWCAESVMITSIAGPILGLLLLFLYVSSPGATGVGVVACFALSIALVFSCIVLLQYSFLKSKYSRELLSYEQYLAAQKKYEERMGCYKVRKQEAECRDAKKEREANKKYNAAKAQIQKLDRPLLDTQALLAKLYGKNIIFEKYRNMVAVCTMYEYFASGRCTELTGATGAYNLYESELRQNYIINQLEQINTKLEQVKQNQYILYRGITETNRIMSEVSSDISQILCMTSQIAVSSSITAFCSQITAANAEMQTYLEAMD